MAAGVGCSSVESPAPVTTADRASLAHGVDISWLSQLEAKGVTWVDSTGTTVDAVSQLHTLGIDAVRLRVMVNPASTSYLSPDGTSMLGYCDQAGMIALALRCQAAGISKFLIDFHFSDTWADPSHQTVPAAWAGHTLAQLETDVADHVTAVLSALKTAGVTPQWVQLGNEEAQGILWGTAGSGKVSGTTGWSSLAALINAGYAAVKAVDPSIAVVLHLDRGGENSLYRWWFDSFQAAGGKWDVIAASFYPYWQPSDSVAMLQANLNDMVSRYGKPVMVAEVGGLYDDPSGTKTLLSQVKGVVASIPQNQGLGVFYWEPESSPTVVGGYLLGASSVYSGQKLEFTAALDGLAYR
jgi:arabinogalactan endo-1,4-beta-galactosidase